jgi:hypothetical protein
MQILIDVPSLPHVADAFGNNAAVQCVCGRAFIFSSQSHYRSGAKCPHCAGLTVYANREHVYRGGAVRGQEDLLFSLTGQDPNTTSAADAVALWSLRRAA